MIFTRRALVLLAASLVLPACHTSVATTVEAEQGAPSLAGLERAVEAAQLELELAESEAAAKQLAPEAAAAATAAADAERALLEWRGERVLEQRKAELAVATARNELAENEQELVQLKLMYAEQDLADQTRDLVIARTQRRNELARDELALAEADLKHLIEVKHSFEEARLTAAVATTAREREAAAAAAGTAGVAAKLAVLKARHALADAQEALAEARADAPEAAK